MSPFIVLHVCMGNICRSPMAEVVLRDRLASAGLSDRVVVDSAGISDEEHGNPVDRRAVVEPGVTNLEITAAAAPHGLYYAPDPSSQQV